MPLGRPTLGLELFNANFNFTRLNELLYNKKKNKTFSVEFKQRADISYSNTIQFPLVAIKRSR